MTDDERSTILDVSNDLGLDTEAALDELERAADMLNIPAVGAVIGGRYTVTEQLGHGAYGWVFGVTHLQLGQRFALKILVPRIAQDPDWVARFREEARATSLIGHENIVFVTDFGHDDEFGEYLVMEYLDGMSLAEVLKREKRQGLDFALRFAIEAGSALSAVHDLDIVHCDLKPSNVFVIRQEGSHERWKLIDFGTSTFVLDAVESDKLFGTPRYMAPEQAAGHPVDHRADQFSFACIIYEMLTGQLPWQIAGWAAALAEVRSAHPPKPPSELSSKCPESLDPIILRALSVEPAKRFPSIEAFVERIQEFVEADITPSPDPFDGRETPRFPRTHTAPRIEVPDLSRTSSIMIGMESKSINALPVLRVVHRNAARLRREYRRNLIAGRMFIPTADTLPENTRVSIQLGYEPISTFVHLTGTTMGSTPSGFGVRIDDDSRKPLTNFLKALRLGFGFLQNDVLSRTAEPAPTWLSAGHAFVLSKLGTESNVSRLRGECSGLPIGFEEAVTELIENGLVQLHQGGAGDSSSVFDQTSSLSQVEIAREFSEGEVAQALENVRVFRDQQNYLAAISVLERLIEVAPNIASFHFELSRLLSEFVGDTDGAITAIDHAVELEPENHQYRGFRTKLVTQLSD